MKKSKFSNLTQSNHLRRQAEELMKKRTIEVGSAQTNFDTSKLIHEFEVYKIEFELQNMELRLALSSVQDSAAKFTELYDFAPVGYFTLTRDGKILESNLFGANLLGKDRSQLIKSSFGFFVADDSKPIFNSFIGKVFKNKKKEECEVSLSKNVDNSLFVHLSGIISKKSDYCLVTAFDVTNRKQAEEALRESEEKYRNLVESSHDLIWKVDSQGIITFLNKVAKTIYGYDPEELIGKSFLDFVPSEQLKKDALIFEESIKDGASVIEYESQFTHKDGHSVHLLANSKILRDENGTIIGTSGTSKDITDSVIARQLLLQNQQRLLKAQKIAGLGYWELEIASGKMIWSDILHEIFGNDKERFEPDYTAFLSFVHPEDREAMEEAQKNALADKIPLDFEHRIIRVNGEVGYIHERAELIFDLLGKAFKLAGSCQDITSRVEREQKIEKYHISLQNLTAEIALVEEMQRKEIASNIHDHLSQSLVISRMKLTGLLKEMKNESQKNELKSIIELVSAALENSRKITYDLCPPVLYELGLIEAMYWLAEKINQDTNLLVFFKSDFEVMDLHESKLIFIFRIIQELTNNIIKHANANKIEIFFVRKDGGVEIKIIDDGEGFDYPEVSKVAAKKNCFGLFAVKERVKNLNGKINISSVISRGTEISIYLPL